MLVELRIRNFAVIEDLGLELGEGLNVLTGETGAGKSIIVGALSLLLGERASSHSVRAGADRASVEALFDLSGRPGVREQVEELGFSADEDLLLLRREVHVEGRSRAWINGSPATAGVVGELGRALLDLHGQHEHQTLLRSPEQRAILDEYAGAVDLAREVAEAHTRLSRVRVELGVREARRRELAARSDFLRFQLREIDEARLRPDEDRDVHEELQRLEHAEELAGDADGVHRLLYADEGSVSDRVAEARELLRRLARIDAGLEPLLDEAEELYHRLAELGRRAGSYASGVEISPARAEELRRRADLLFRLKRKYGPELADVLRTRERVAAELAELEGADVEMEELERERLRLGGVLAEGAAALTRARREAGERLAHEVEEVLPRLGMPGARFAVELEPLDEPESGGAERVRFTASLNPGFELRPLSRIASGGELSRVMLALKSILAREDHVPTVIFDEIDAGIGGEVAAAVARKLRDVARHHQVIVVTHLAQLASRGDRHLHVEKTERRGIAVATVRPLEGEERIREIARMLGGDADSEASRDHARELLSAAPGG